jgi:hypothetical protein
MSEVNMAPSHTSALTTYDPVRISLAATAVAYVFLLLFTTVGGEVLPFVWWLLLVLPLGAGITHVATRRIVILQLPLVVAFAVLTLAGLLTTNAVAQLAAGRANIPVGTLLIGSVFLVGTLSYMSSSRHYDLRALLNMRFGRLEERTGIVIDERYGERTPSPKRKQAFREFFPPWLVAIVGCFYGAITMLTEGGIVAIIGISGLMMSYLMAVGLAQSLHMLVMTLTWERTHRKPLRRSEKNRRTDGRRQSKD